MINNLRLVLTDFKETTDIQLAKTVRDARRFLFPFQRIIDTFPLQVYASALFFSPSQSLIKTLFHLELPKWTTVRAAAGLNWSACLQTLEGHRGAIDTLLFSPNGNILASGSRDDLVKLWDTRTGRCIQTLDNNYSTYRLMAFSHNNELLACGTKNTCEIKIWDITSGACLYSTDLPRSPLWLGFLPSTKLVNALKDHHKILMHEAHGFVFLREPKDRKELVWIWNSSDGRMLATGSYWYKDPSWQVVHAWDVESGKCLWTHNNAMRVHEISYEGQLLIQDFNDGGVKVFDIRSGKQRATVLDQDAHHRKSSSSHGRRNAIVPEKSKNEYTLSPDGKLLVILESGNTLGLWSINRGAYLLSFEGHSHSVQAVTFAPHGNLLATGSLDHTIKLWEINKKLPGKKVGNHESRIRELIFSPNGAFAASLSDDHNLKIWDACSGECMHTLPGKNTLIYETNFSPDSNKLISLCEYIEYGIHIWDVRSGKYIFLLMDVHYKFSVRFSPDSDLAATIEFNGRITIWDSGSGKKLRVLDLGNQDRQYFRAGQRVTFSHDSKLLAALIVLFSSEKNGRDTPPNAPGARVVLFDIHSGERLRTIEVDRGTGIFVFSPDKKKLAIEAPGSRGDAVVNIWDFKTGAFVKQISCSAKFAVAFTADGTYLALESLDSTFTSHKNVVSIVEVESGICVQKFTGVRPSAIGSSTGTNKFNFSNSLIETTGGTFAVQKAADGSIALVTESQFARYLGANLSEDRMWVENDGEKFLWIPQEYRPGCYAVFGNKIAVGTKTGHVWICRTCPDEVWEKRKREHTERGCNSA